MKNKEKYFDEFIEVSFIEEKCSFIVKREIYNCDGLCGKCMEALKTWFEKEYKEPIKLSDVERVILDSIDDRWEWIARDKSCDLFLFVEKPNKYEYGWTDNKQCTDFIAFNHLFSFIQWEDDEPYSIKELLKNNRF